MKELLESKNGRTPSNNYQAPKLFLQNQVLWHLQLYDWVQFLASLISFLKVASSIVTLQTNV
jgi:hypothetical protein